MTKQEQNAFDIAAVEHYRKLAIILERNGNTASAKRAIRISEHIQKIINERN
jgi:hypothetical protein